MKLTQILGIHFIRLKYWVLSLISVRKTAMQAFELFCTPMEKPPVHTPTVFSFAEELHDFFEDQHIRGYRWNRAHQHKILILHGFSSASVKFHRYVAPLVEKGYEVVAFDAPAHGKSGGKTINAMEYARLIEKLHREYGPFNGFIAHSFGGLALTLALEKLPHDAATRVVLIAPNTETTTAIDIAFDKLKLRNARVRAAFDQLIWEKGGQPASWFSVNRAITHCKAEVLWIHDEDDSITPLKDALVTRDKQLPNIRFIITKGLGHRRIYRDENVRNTIVAFL
jgi:pimeloyl-ACP methyl ester carboxylesterase